MRVFKTRFFSKFADKCSIDDLDLCDAVRRATTGLIDADLGGGVIKQRIARKGQGKSGGFRTIILFRSGDRAIFVNGYAKKDTANIDDADLRDYRKLAKVLLAYTQTELNELVSSAKFAEVKYDENQVS